MTGSIIWSEILWGKQHFKALTNAKDSDDPRGMKFVLNLPILMLRKKSSTKGVLLLFFRVKFLNNENPQAETLK